VDAKAKVTCGAVDGCVTTNPLFANTSAGDYGLTVASPCKDTGAVESWMGDAYDLAGAPRVFGAAPICRSSNWHDSECSRCARRTMLFLKVVLVVSQPHGSLSDQE
jgi:hypothetical protein